MKSTHIFTQREQALLLIGIFGMLSCQNLGAQYPPYGSTNSTQTNNIAPQIPFDKALLTPDGTFTEQSLPKFLAKAYNEKKLINEDFSKEACIKAKKMDVKGSFNTVQLFLVTTTCRPTQASIYIIKEARTGLEETMKLKAVEQFPGMKELLAPGVPPKGLPSVALPLAYFSYGTDYSLHYIAAMPAAKGKVLCEIVGQFRDNQSPQNAERIKRAYKILGNELANFHKRFMKPVPGAKIGKTIAHGDFHCFNVFYDEIGGHFTFIDNETMEASLKNPLSPADDILKLFFGLFSSSEPDARKDIIKNIDLKKWHDLALKSFIEGYLDAYAPVDQKQVLQDLKTMFNSDVVYKQYTGSWLKIDAPRLKEIRTKYINPVFDEIQKQRIK